MFDLGIIGGKVYFENRFSQTNIYIKDGKIAHISPLSLKCKELYHCNGNLVLPGIIDPHTPFQLDLGTISSRDDFNDGTKAAAFGGITTIIDFLDPVSNKEELLDAFHKRRKQAKNSHIDYKFHACLKNPKGYINELVKTCQILGLNTIKVFTTYSESNRRTYDSEIIELLRQTTTNDFMLTVHIENDDLINLQSQYTYKDLPISRPVIAETKEALKLASYTRGTKGTMYMVHCSSGETILQLKEQYSDILNKNFFIESCPHYFVFDQSVLEKEHGYLYTMAPPLRTRKEVKQLRSLIDDVYTIGTDHCAFNKRDKQKRYLDSIPLGVGGVEYSFPIMHTLFGHKIIDKMTKNVAIAHKLFPQKGIIQEGSDADLFIYQLHNTRLTKNHGFADYTIYKGFPVKGEVISTITNGNFVVKDSKFHKQTGNLLNKEGK